MTEIRFKTGYQLGNQVYRAGDTAEVAEPRAGQLIAEKRATPARTATAEDDGSKPKARRKPSKRSSSDDSDEDAADDTSDPNADDAFLNPDVSVQGNADKLPRGDNYGSRQRP